MQGRLGSSGSQSCYSTFPLGWQWRVLWSSLLHCVRLAPHKTSQENREQSSAQVSSHGFLTSVVCVPTSFVLLQRG